MIRIQIQRDGSVTGDVGRILAYENQTKSNKIQFLHPSYPGAIYRVVYGWGTTSFMDMLDGNDQVQIYINGTGIVQLHFEAVNAVTGEVIMASKPFNLVVHKSSVMGPDSFTSCKHTHHHGYGGSCVCGENNNPTLGLMQLSTELANEQQVRASSDSQIWEEIYAMKQSLALFGVSDETMPSEKLDCDTLITSGPYNLSDLSTHTPIEGKNFSIVVRQFLPQILQTAYMAEQGETGVFYRTGTLISGDSNVVWQDWIPMIHEVTVTEV